MERAGFLAAYMRFVALATVAGTVVAGLGYVPTVKMAGDAAIWSMMAGCGVSWAASCVGAIPLALVSSRGTDSATAVLASTGVRFLVVLLLVVPLVFSGWLTKNVFVFWVGVSYLLMLFVDTTFALRLVKPTNENES